MTVTNRKGVLMHTLQKGFIIIEEGGEEYLLNSVEDILRFRGKVADIYLKADRCKVDVLFDTDSEDDETPWNTIKVDCEALKKRRAEESKKKTGRKPAKKKKKKTVMKLSQLAKKERSQEDKPRTIFDIRETDGTRADLDRWCAELREINSRSADRWWP
jgi:hypothetical protein